MDEDINHQDDGQPYPYSIPDLDVERHDQAGESHNQERNENRHDGRTRQIEHGVGWGPANCCATLFARETR